MEGGDNNIEGAHHLFCQVCNDEGILILCDTCPYSFHQDCLNIQTLPDGDWSCPLCTGEGLMKKEEADNLHCKKIVEEGQEKIPGLEVRFVSPEIGRGVFTTKRLGKGEFVSYYEGDCVSKREGQRRDKTYDDSVGSFLFFFKNSFGRNMCIDATYGSCLARLFNDAEEGSIEQNCKVSLQGQKLAIHATRNIEPEEELRYDYGVTDLPWRQATWAKHEPIESDVPEDTQKEAAYKEDHSVWVLYDGVSWPAFVQEVIEQVFILGFWNEPGVILRVKEKDILGCFVPNETTYENSRAKLLKKKKFSSLSLLEQAYKLAAEDYNRGRAQVVELEVHSSEESTERHDLSCLAGTDDIHVCGKKKGDTTVFNTGKKVEEKKTDSDGDGESNDPDSLLSDETVISDSDNDGHPNDPEPEYVLSEKDGKGDTHISHMRVEDENPMTTLSSTGAKADETLISDSDSDGDLNDPDYVLSEEDSEEDASSMILEVTSGKGDTYIPDFTVGSKTPPVTDITVECETTVTTLSTTHIRTTTNESCNNVTTDTDMKDITSCGIQTNEKTRKKPDRFCIYCKTMVTGGKLKRHVIRKHRTNPEVKEALEKPKHMLNMFIDKLRLEGIYTFNMNRVSTTGKVDTSDFMRERKTKYPEDKLKMCSGCKKFLGSKTFYKHRQQCSNLNSEPLNMGTLIPSDFEAVHKDKEFTDKILNRFRDTEVGRVCRGDKIIQQVGYRHFCLRRSEKSKSGEIRKNIMCEMRELARLFLQFQSLTEDNVKTADMFKRKYLSILREAIEKMSSGDEKEKYGLKLNLNSIIQRTIKSLKGFYMEQGDDNNATETEKFQTAYAFRAHELFAGARFQLIKASTEKARRPENLPKAEAMKMLKAYMNDEIENIIKTFEPCKDFCWLRSLCVARLTLFNARRGDEPSRLMLTEWHDALKGTWLPQEKVEVIEDEGEKMLIGQFILAYLHGKGAKMVPMLIPKDLIKAIELLVSARKAHGIKAINPFLFATKLSQNHCLGWHAVHEVCKKAQININATKNRHYVSTIYASLDMSPGDQKVFLDHMGHAAAINQEVYQCPLGIKEVRVMGSLLKDIDEEVSSAGSPGKLEKLHEYQSSSSTVESGHSIMEIKVEKKAGAPSAARPRYSQVSVRWTKKAEENLHAYFNDYFSDAIKGMKNKGALPGKEEIMQFLQKNKFSFLTSLTEQDAYKKVRAKLFNQRKKLREALKNNLQ